MAERWGQRASAAEATAEPQVLIGRGPASQGGVTRGDDTGTRERPKALVPHQQEDFIFAPAKSEWHPPPSDWLSIGNVHLSEVTATGERPRADPGSSLLWPSHDAGPCRLHPIGQNQSPDPWLTAKDAGKQLLAHG